MSQQVDRRIVKKIYEFVGDGIRSVKEMQRILNLYVKNELFHGETVPPPEIRRFFPLDRDIRNHMYRATVKLKLSKIDQENLYIIQSYKVFICNDGLDVEFSLPWLWRS